MWRLQSTRATELDGVAPRTLRADKNQKAQQLRRAFLFTELRLRYSADAAAGFLLAVFPPCALTPVVSEMRMS